MKSNITMKTILILTLAFGIQISGLVANNIGEVVNTNSTIALTSLAPTVPMEATFIETTEFDISMNLIPSVPMEAEFDDGVEVELASARFSPVPPADADFEEAVDLTPIHP